MKKNEYESIHPEGSLNNLQSRIIKYNLLQSFRKRTPCLQMTPHRKKYQNVGFP